MLIISLYVSVPVTPEWEFQLQVLTRAMCFYKEMNIFRQQTMSHLPFIACLIRGSFAYSSDMEFLQNKIITRPLDLNPSFNCQNVT